MKRLITRIGQFFKKLFTDGFGFLRNNSEIAVKVVDIIKTVVESPLTELVVDWTKLPVDDALLPKIKEHVQKAAVHVGIAHGILKSETDQSDAVGALINYLKTLTPDARAAYWLVLSGKVNEILADGKITFAEAVALAQMVYAERKG